MLRNTLNIILAFLVLASTTGVSLSQHFCQDRLVNISVYKIAESCGMEMESNTGFCEKTSISKKNCCKDETRFLKIETKFTAKDKENNPLKDLQLAALLSIILEPSFYPATHNSDYLNYKPPLIPEDKRILHQSFLC